jgi:hypothetical protein
MFTLTDPFLYTVSQSSRIPEDSHENMDYESLTPNINNIWCNTERFQPVIRQCYESLESGNTVIVRDNRNVKYKVKLLKITARYMDENTKNIVINWNAELITF